MGNFINPSKLEFLWIFYHLAGDSLSEVNTRVIKQPNLNYQTIRILTSCKNFNFFWKKLEYLLYRRFHDLETRKFKDVHFCNSLVFCAIFGYQKTFPLNSQIISYAAWIS